MPSTEEVLNPTHDIYQPVHASDFPSAGGRCALSVGDLEFWSVFVLTHQSLSRIFTPKQLFISSGITNKLIGSWA